MLTDINDFYVFIGNKIREFRLKAEISQEEFAEKLGLTRASIVNIEKGRQRPMLHTLFSISQILLVPVSNILPKEIVVPQTKKSTEWIDFTEVQSDEFYVDLSTQSAVKKFVSDIKY